MTCKESHHPPPKAVTNVNTAGHPNGIEMLAGALLVIAGTLIFFTWVGTFQSIYALGIFPMIFGYILLFHSEPILETLQQWRATGAKAH
jgi:hypothetical protein